MEALKAGFFKQKTLEIAKDLLGKYLVAKSAEGTTIGKIVETEAYLWGDEASHSYRGKTLRNAAMFEEAGTIYVYFIYGNHYCFNIVTNKKGIGEAVLIRALEPLEGLELMKKRRKVDELKRLCNGPANLVKALGINKEDNCSKINESRIKLFKSEKIGEKEIVKTNRIGIVKGCKEKYRFYIRGNEFVSRK